MTLLLAAALLSLALPAGAAAPLAWRVTGAETPGRAVCLDGDARCDRDGTADGACTFGVALCPGGATSVRVRGAGAAALRRALAALAPPATCTAEVAVRVRAGRRARASAAARDPTSGRTERRRLRLGCVRPHAARAVIVTTDFETGLLATVGVRPPPRVTPPATAIPPDAVVRVAGERVYVVNRFLGDN